MDSTTLFEHRGRLKETRPPDFTFLYGYLLLFSTFIFFIVTMYTIIISKFMPETGNAILDSIKVRQLPVNAI
jgi:hypothetical protein